MQFWDNIINTALIGTDKKQLIAHDLIDEFAKPFEIVNAETNIDKEEKFLQLASVAYNFRQSGVAAISKEGATIPEAHAEENPYCNTAAISVLKEILEENSNGLFKLWVNECVNKRWLVTPELVPKLLDIAIHQKVLRSEIVRTCGKRAEWLSTFNPDWNFSISISDQELWQTGTPEQRKLVLQQTRLTDPAKGLEWLQQTWAEENANSKAELLKQLATNISVDDVEWLEKLQSEKSQIVKDQALELLKQVPQSTVVKQYEEILRQTVTIKKEKSFLGMVSKTALHIELPAVINENIFKTGIEKLSNSKEFTDDEYIIYQLMKSVPPSFWETQLGLTPENIIQSFQREKGFKRFIPALIMSVTHFKDTSWGIFFMQYSEVFYIDLIPLLLVKQQEHYSTKFFEQHEQSIIQYATARDTEWSIELTKLIFKYLAKNPYHYNRTFYNQNIHLIPVSIIGELEKCTPPEEQYRAMWSNTSDYIVKLISLKIQMIKAFNS